MKAQIVVGDCRKVLRQMDEESIDLIVTSPPYNAGKDYGFYDDSQAWEDYFEFIAECCVEMYRVIRPNCNIFVNIADVGVSNRDASKEESIGPRGNFQVKPTHCHIVLAMTSIGAQYLHPIMWRKVANCNTQFGAAGRFSGSYPYPNNPHVPSEMEYILHFRKNGLRRRVAAEVKERSRISKERWLELSSQVWEIPGVRQRGHPAQFPLELPTRVIEGWSFWGDTVLDPFAGVGTTGVAATRLGRNFVGVEIGPQWAVKAKHLIDSELTTAQEGAE